MDLYKGETEIFPFLEVFPLPAYAKEEVPGTAPTTVDTPPTSPTL